MSLNALRVVAKAARARASERRCGIAMSGSDIAMPQKHEAAAARKLCLCASLMGNVSIKSYMDMCINACSRPPAVSSSVAFGCRAMIR
eukprot:6202056-Pleurochrysis_carterae.AAC.3